MQPTIALSFQTDEIALLCRSREGWLALGACAVDSPELGRQLADMRARAVALLGPERPLRALLLVPHDLVRFARIPTTVRTRAAQERHVVAALAGLTPYEVDELAFDWTDSSEPGHLDIAIVARETLDEAEAFASEQGFPAVAFGTLDQPGVYDATAWFGRAAGAEANVRAERGVIRPLPVEPDPAPAAPVSDDALPLFAAPETAGQATASIHSELPEAIDATEAQPAVFDNAPEQPASDPLVAEEVISEAPESLAPEAPVAEPVSPDDFQSVATSPAAPVSDDRAGDTGLENAAPNTAEETNPPSDMEANAASAEVLGPVLGPVHGSGPDLHGAPEAPKAEAPEPVTAPPSRPFDAPLEQPAAPAVVLPPPIKPIPAVVPAAPPLAALRVASAASATERATAATRAVRAGVQSSLGPVFAAALASAQQRGGDALSAFMGLPQRLRFALAAAGLLLVVGLGALAFWPAPPATGPSASDPTIPSPAPLANVAPSVPDTAQPAAEPPAAPAASAPSVAAVEEQPAPSSLPVAEATTEAEALNPPDAAPAAPDAEPRAAIPPPRPSPFRSVLPPAAEVEPAQPLIESAEGTIAEPVPPPVAEVAVAPPTPEAPPPAAAQTDPAASGAIAAPAIVPAMDAPGETPRDPVVVLTGVLAAVPDLPPVPVMDAPEAPLAPPPAGLIMRFLPASPDDAAAPALQAVPLRLGKPPVVPPPRPVPPEPPTTDQGSLAPAMTPAATDADTTEITALAPTVSEGDAAPAIDDLPPAGAEAAVAVAEPQAAEVLPDPGAVVADQTLLSVAVPASDVGEAATALPPVPEAQAALTPETQAAPEVVAEETTQSDPPIAALADTATADPVSDAPLAAALPAVDPASETPAAVVENTPVPDVATDAEALADLDPEVAAALEIDASGDPALDLAAPEDTLMESASFGAEEGEAARLDGPVLPDPTAEAAIAPATETPMDVAQLTPEVAPDAPEVADAGATRVASEAAVQSTPTIATEAAAEGLPSTDPQVMPAQTEILPVAVQPAAPAADPDVLEGFEIAAGPPTASASPAPETPGPDPALPEAPGSAVASPGAPAPDLPADDTAAAEAVPDPTRTAEIAEAANATVEDLSNDRPLGPLPPRPLPRAASVVQAPMSVAPVPRPPARPQALTRPTARALATAARSAPRPPPRPARLQRSTADLAAGQLVISSLPPVAPSEPTSRLVAREATVAFGLDLTEVNLLGVFGTQRNRLALVRLANGRIERVKVGDTLDGGRVTAIGEADLRLTRGGQNITLRMPRN